MLGKILRDDKGTLLIGAFGLPTRDQEYRPDDAIRAGRAIAAHARERGLTCQVGIASGKTFCGPIGSPQRREYTIIGEVPNRAARLTGLGVEGVVCDPQTRRLARDWAFEPAGTVKLKGLAAPVPVFTPSEEGHGSTYGGTVAHDRLVGRETELARLERAVAELIEGRKLRVFGSPPPGPERDKLAEAASAARWLMEPALYVVDSPVAYPASVFWHVNLAERAGADATPAGLAAVGIISGGMKKPAVAERYFLRAREAADGGEERWERYHAYVTEAFYYALNTRWQKAAEVAGDVAAAAEAIGHDRCRRWIELTGGLREIFQGHFGAAAPQLESAVRGAAGKGHDTDESTSLALLTLARYELGEPDAIAAAMPQLVELSGPDAPAYRRIWRSTLQALRCRDLGDLAGLLAASQEAVEAIGTRKWADFTTVFQFAWLAEALLDRWDNAPDPAVWKATTRAVLDLQAMHGKAFMVAEVGWLTNQGRWLARAGKAPKARKLFERGAALARERSMTFDEAVALHALSGLADGDPTAAASAQALFVEQGIGRRIAG